MQAFRKEDLPFVGSSYHFVGADRGDVAVSMFLVEAQPGRGAPLHVHEYDEILMTQEGRARIVVDAEIRECVPGARQPDRNSPHGRHIRRLCLCWK